MAVTLTDEQEKRIIRLGCQVIHRAGQARDFSKDGNLTHAFAEYYAMDTELLGRLFTVLPEHMQEAMLAGLASEGGSSGAGK